MAAMLLSNSPALEPVPVKIETTSAGFQIVRDGKPYFVKGVGGTSEMAKLVEAGGNTVRTWGAEEAGKALDEAQKHGLTVVVGLWLGHKEHGFKYDDPKQVEAQYNSARDAILKYRNHPALLAWGIGNEMEMIDQGADPVVWKAVEDIAKFAKQNDPNHPTMTVVAELGGDKIKNLVKNCPGIDMIGINSYGGATSVGERYRAFQVKKPYLLTEFGPLGQWEVGKTSWGAPIEATSTEKAKHYREAYQKAVLDQKGYCLGSFAFLWGNKQEATATWFGMMLPDGTKVGSVDAISEMWTGKKPRYLCPEIASLELVGAPVVKPGSTIQFKLATSDPNGGKLSVNWELLDEATVLGSGGSFEPTPHKHEGAVLQSSAGAASIKVPDVAKAYRVFVTVRNEHGGAATANVPILAK